MSGKDETDNSDFYWTLAASIGLSLISFLGRITVVLRESWSVGLGQGHCRGPPDSGLSLRFPPGLPLPHLRRRLRAAADFIHVDIFCMFIICPLVLRRVCHLYLQCDVGHSEHVGHLCCTYHSMVFTGSIFNCT
jgi:hypothetical protein